MGALLMPHFYLPNASKLVLISPPHTSPTMDSIVLIGPLEKAKVVDIIYNALKAKSPEISKLLDAKIKDTDRHFQLSRSRGKCILGRWFGSFLDRIHRPKSA